MTDGRPYWADALGTPPSQPFEGGSVRADVAVVGGGLAGLSIALHALAAWPSARVVVLEADRYGAGASGRNTGMLGPGVGQSFLALQKRFGDEQATRLYRATLDAVSLAGALVRDEGLGCDLTMGGQLSWARTRADRRRLRRQATAMTALRLPVEEITDERFARAFGLAVASGHPEDGPAALRFAHAGTLHPGKLVAALCDRVARRGGRLLHGARVTRIHRDRIELAGGEVRADRVVLATAGYTAGLGVMRSQVLPVHLQALATAPLPRGPLPFREGVVEARRLFSYFRPTADGRVVFGGGAPRYALGGSPGDDARAHRRLEARLRGTWPDAVVTHRWTGVIGYTLDALPAIGRSRDNPRLLHALGWCGHGVALALAAGAWLRPLLDDDRACAELPTLPWHRASAPALPGELLRWMCFGAAVRAMRIADACEAR